MVFIRFSVDITFLQPLPTSTVAVKAENLEFFKLTREKLQNHVTSSHPPHYSLIYCCLQRDE